MPRSRRYCYTKFDVDDDNKHPEFDKTCMDYMIVGHEQCPKTKRWHWQGYVRFAEAKTFSAAKKALKNNNIHIETCKGTEEANIKYCSKDKDFHEFGKRATPGKRNDVCEFKDAIISGLTNKELLDSYPNLYMRMNKVVEHVRDIIQEERNFKTRVICLWGETGSGKTRTAIEHYKAKPISYHNGFWIGYENQECVLIDEIDKSRIPCKELLQMFDRYPMNLNVKGGQKKFNSKTLVITSTKNPSNWSYHDDLLKQILRRIDFIEHKNGTTEVVGNTNDNLHIDFDP